MLDLPWVSVPCRGIGVAYTEVAGAHYDASFLPSKQIHCLHRSNVWPPAPHSLVHRPVGSIEPTGDWPLFYEGERRMHFAYAIFALNKV